MKISREQRNEAYEQLMHGYLKEELAKNIYDKKKLLDEDFSNRDSEIAKNAKIIKNGIVGTEMMEYQIELQQKIKEQVLDFAFEMYQQGMRDMAKVLR